MSSGARLASVLGRVPGSAWAALGGLAWALCFADRGLLLGPWVALAPLVALLGSKRPTWYAFVHGTAFWGASLYWIPATVVTFGRVPWALGILGLVLLASFISLLFWVPFGYLGQRLWAAGRWRRYAGLPALWVALEWLREYILSGFPWNLAAYALVEVPGALPLAALVGSYGLAFLVVWVNVALVGSLGERRWRPLAAAVGVTLVGLLVGAWIRPENGVGEAARKVRVLQPNIPNLTAWDEAQVQRNYRQVLAQATAACEPGALLVLPESALWPYTYERHPSLVAALDAIAEGGCWLLINSITSAGEAYYNSTLLIGPEGIEGRYDKRHLVPFGEYVPLQGVFTWLDKLSRLAGDFTAGAEPALMRWGDEQLAAAICYEVVYPGSVANQVRAGATMLVTVTNDAWYGDTTAPWQHLRAPQLRAAENARPMLRAAITGVSAVIAADGSITDFLGVGEKGVLAARVVGRDRLTPYSRAPWLVPLACCLVALLAYARVP
ncbi:MAG: apolipoprotein N-acyltransferase, partial [Acidobacteria bacterium]|nr:apolipoprotein N-acyltransferase [Acidobacteriota bacterium]